MKKRPSRQGMTRESGQALVLFALGAVALLGIVGLAVDGGQLVYTRTALQNSADAAAFAGSQDLPNEATAKSVANAYVTRNGGAGCQPGCASVNAAKDVITVTTTKRVQYTFLRALGMDGADVTATAAVRSQVATGFNFGHPHVFPFAIWGGNPSYPGCSAPYGICPGASKTYRSNQWDSQVANSQKQNGNWTVPGNNFKGYFNTSGQQETVYQSDPSTQYSFGGNAIGQEPVDDLHAHFVSKTPIILPVVTKGNCTNNCGTLNFTIVAWVAVMLDQDPGSANGPWSGTVVANYATAGGSGGGFIPGGTYPSIRSTQLVK